MDNEQTITVDGVEYLASELSEQALEYLHHVNDLNNKVNEAEYQLKQLRVSLTAFLTMFKKSLPEKEEENAD